MEYQKLDPRAVKMWRVSRFILLVFLLAAYVAMAFFLVKTFGPGLKPVLLPLLLGLLPLAAQLLNLLLYPPIEYRQWSYLITPDRIEIKKGIIFHSVRVIPISRIQHVMVSEGPLARHFKLASVTIHTAGGSMAIEGLAAETAQEICENLKTVVNRKARFEPAQTGG